MEIIYILIPVSIVLVGAIVYALFWAINTDQFEDMEGPRHRILMDDDRIKPGEDKS